MRWRGPRLLRLSLGGLCGQQSGFHWELWAPGSSSHLRRQGTGMFIFPLLLVIGRGLPAMCGMEGASGKRKSSG